MAGEGPQMKSARENAEKNGVNGDHDWPRDPFGTPMVKISGAAAELVPTVQYGNVTVGPIVVTRFVPFGGVEKLQQDIRETQSIVEQAVAEERQTVHALIQQSKQGRQ